MILNTTNAPFYPVADDTTYRPVPCPRRNLPTLLPTLRLLPADFQFFATYLPPTYRRACASCLATGTVTTLHTVPDAATGADCNIPPVPSPPSHACPTAPHTTFAAVPLPGPFPAPYHTFTATGQAGAA